MVQVRAFTESFDAYPTNVNQAGYGVNSTWINANRLNECGINPGRFGGQALRGAGQGSGYRPILSSTQVVAGVAFYFAGGGNNPGQKPIAFRSSNGNEQIRLGVTDTGLLQVVRGSTVLASTALPVITQFAWAYLEMAVTLSDTTGNVRVWLNDTLMPELSLDNVDTKNHSDADIGQFLFVIDSTTAMIDDMYCEVGGTTRVGEGRITTRLVTGDDAVQFLRSAGATNFSCLDELPPTTADYTYSSTIGEKDLFTVADMDYTPQSIYGVQVVMLATKDDAGTRSIRSRVVSGATEANGPNFTLTLSSSIFDRSWFPTNPNGSVPWTKAAVDAVKIGYEVMT